MLTEFLWAPFPQRIKETKEQNEKVVFERDVTLSEELATFELFC